MKTSNEVKFFPIIDNGKSSRIVNSYRPRICLGVMNHKSHDPPNAQCMYASTTCDANNPDPFPRRRRETISLDIVTEVALSLIEQGDRVSVRNVHRAIGRGSFRDITRLLGQAKLSGKIPSDKAGVGNECLRRHFMLAMNYITLVTQWHSREVVLGRIHDEFPEPPASLIGQSRLTTGLAGGEIGNVTPSGNVTCEGLADLVVIIDEESDPGSPPSESPDKGTLLACGPKLQVVVVSDCASMDTPAAEGSLKDRPPGVPVSDASWGTPSSPPCNTREIHVDDDEVAS